MKKRITSVLLVLALCLTLLPTAALAADEHQNHCICGAVHGSIGDHTGQQNVFDDTAVELKVENDTLKKGKGNWDPENVAVYNNDMESAYVLNNGTYYLGSDLDFTGKTTEYAIVITGDVTLCLNGHSITCTNKEGVICVQANACQSLTLTDCKGTGKIIGGTSGAVDVRNGKTFNMYGGTLTGSSGQGVYLNGSKSGTTTFNMYGGVIGGAVDDTDATGNTGSGVKVETNCAFNMYGGTISKNTTRYGGGVYMSGGTFTMSGTAKITGNTVSYNGGGVYMMGGTFTMSGGEITGNTAKVNGGGVYVKDSTFTMSSAKITGNTATGNSSSYGGGVFVDNGTFAMSGTAAITGNTAKTDGGGVNMNGGTFTVSGAPTITGNKRGLDVTDNNVYLYNGKTITIGDDGLNKVGDTTPQIGVTVASSSTNVPTEDNPVAITSANAKEAYKDYFVSDSDKCLIQFNNTNNTVELAAKPKIVLTADNTTITKTSSLLVYDGNKHSPTITVTYTDPDTKTQKVLTENDDYTVSGNTATNAGYYTLKVTGTGDYTGEVTQRWTIDRRTVSVTAVALRDKTYNGSTKGSSDDVASVEFKDLSNQTVTLTKDVDYTIESVTYTDANASEQAQDRVAVKVNLVQGGNYAYQYGALSPTSPFYTKGKIIKAEAPETSAKTLEVKNNFADRYTLDLSTLLPILTVGKFGHIDCYTLLGEVKMADGYYDSSNPATIDGSMLTLPIKAATSVEAGQQIGTVKVTVTTQNYKDITLTINVKAVAASEGIPTIDKEPTAQNLTYTGQAQELITEGAATNGTMMYRLEDATDYSAAIPTATEAGRYTVYYMVKGSDGYKDIKNETTMQVTATISRASQTVTIPSGKSITKNGVGVDISTWASAAGVPGGSDLGELTYSLTGGACDGVTLEGTVLTVQKETTAGSIIIKVQAAATKNYEASEEKTFTVTVTDKETVTISGLTYADKTYDGKIIVPTGKLTVTDSKVPAEELEVLYEGTNDTVYSSTEAPKNVGTYKVTYKVADSNENYTGSVTYAFTIAPKAVTAAPANKTITKGSAIPTFELTYTGLVTGETLTPSPAPEFSCFEKNGTTPVSTSTAAGTYTITWTNMDGTTFGNGNYTVTPSATGTLTISNRPSSGGGGGGGGASAPTYPVSSSNASASAAVGGSVSISTKNASAGDTVTVTVSPEAGYRLGKLTVVDKNGKEIPVTLKDGKYTFTMPASQVDIKPVFEKIPAETAEPTFPDVPSSAYYAEPVKWAAEKGITSGTKDGGFAPGNTCTRAQIVTFLWRAAGSPEPQTTQTGMTDVSPAAYYAKAVAWAIENGITVGRSDGSFNPNGTCTRANGVTFLYRAAKAAASGNDAGFSDVAADAYYAAAVQWALENGITNGQSNGLFGPNGACTRAQIVTFLYRLYVKA